MANRQTRWLLDHGRSNKNVAGSNPARAETTERPLFHGKECCTAKLRKESGKKPRDEGRRLRALSDKRVLDKRINPPWANRVYAS